MFSAAAYTTIGKIWVGSMLVLLLLAVLAASFLYFQNKRRNAQTNALTAIPYV